jgi:hypothetical protein
MLLLSMHASSGVMVVEATGEENTFIYEIFLIILRLIIYRIFSTSSTVTRQQCDEIER